MVTTVSIEIMELEHSSFLVLVPSVFNTNEERYWIIDTGASKTVVNKDLNMLYKSMSGAVDEVYTASNIHEREKLTMGVVNDFRIGEMLVKKMKVVLLDLSHLDPLYKKLKGREVCGLLGSDFLNKYKARIDYKERILKLETV